MTNSRFNSPFDSSSMTTLVCLFHDRLQAQEAVEGILSQGFTECSVIGADTFGRDRLLLEFASIGLPAQHNYAFARIVAEGGGLVWLRCRSKESVHAEAIFERHHGEQIDEVAFQRFHASESLAA